MGRRTLFRRAHLGLQTCSSTCENALRGGAVSRRAARACCRAATRAPEGVCAGIFVANRSSARAAGRERRRGPTAGAAGLRRANVSRDSKRLGARGSAWPCVSEVAAAVRGRFQLKNWSRACACQGISWNCVNDFATVRKRLVQANACSGRPRRDPPLGCGAGGPAQHGPPRGRSRDRALLKFDRCAPASSLGFTPLPARCALGPASHESQCAARRAWPAGALRDGVDSLCADRRRCAPWERGVSGSGGARACSRERVSARATPTH